VWQILDIIYQHFVLGTELGSGVFVSSGTLTFIPRVGGNPTA